MNLRLNHATAWLAVAVILLTGIFYGPINNFRWDPSFYYAQLRSPLIDGNFNFRNETQPLNGISTVTALGMQPSPWPVGPALLWSPFFAGAHLLTWLFRPAVADGFSSLYIAAVSAGSAMYGLLGVWVCYRACRYYGPPWLAGLMAGLMLAASPLFYYTFRQPIMAHSTSFFAAAGLVLACIAFERGILSVRHSGLVFGALVGLNALLRWASALLVILPLGLLLWHGLAALHRGDRDASRALGLQILVLACVGGITFSPQLAMWYRLHGEWLVFPSVGFSMSNMPTHLLFLFFHTNRGLFFWAPAVVLGFAGLLALPDRRLRVVSCLYLCAYILVLSLWRDWYGGGGMGARYFVETLPLAALGLVTLGQRLAARTAGFVVPALLCLGSAVLTLHHLNLMVMIEQVRLPMTDYFAGRPLGFLVQLSGLKQLLLSPAILIASRPLLPNDRQALIINLLAGQTDSRMYIMPGVALLTFLLTLLVIPGAARLRPERLALTCATGIIGLSVLWFVLLLAVGRV